MNSLAFTFLAQVSELFNVPLLGFYSKKAIEGLDESYGSDPIYYLVTEYSEENVDEDGDWAGSWYIKQDQQFAGLLTDFSFRHTPGSYPQPNAAFIELLRYIFLAAPFISTLSCWIAFREDSPVTIVSKGFFNMFGLLST